MPATKHSYNQHESEEEKEAESIRRLNLERKRLKCLGCGIMMITDRCHRFCRRCLRRSNNQRNKQEYPDPTIERGSGSWQREDIFSEIDRRPPQRKSPRKLYDDTNGKAHLKSMPSAQVSTSLANLASDLYQNNSTFALESSYCIDDDPID